MIIAALYSMWVYLFISGYVSFAPFGLSKVSCGGQPTNNLLWLHIGNLKWTFPQEENLISIFYFGNSTNPIYSFHDDGYYDSSMNNLLQLGVQPNVLYGSNVHFFNSSSFLSE